MQHEKLNPQYKLSKNFQLWEFTRSQTASRLNLPNQPTVEHVDNMIALCENVLQPVRDHFGPVNISSGFRSHQLNQAVGGSDLSDHRKGCAADIEVLDPLVSNFALAKWIRDNVPEFDQLILEFPDTTLKGGWVHVSFEAGKNKNEVLTFATKNGRVVKQYGLYWNNVKG